MGLDEGLRENITTKYYGAGHMMYVQQSSLQNMAEDLRAFVAEAT